MVAAPLSPTIRGRMQEDLGQAVGVYRLLCRRSLQVITACRIESQDRIFSPITSPQFYGVPIVSSLSQFALKMTRERKVSVSTTGETRVAACLGEKSLLSGDIYHHC